MTTKKERASRPVDLQGMRVLVTGGTCGLGKALGLEFAQAGTTVFLTHRWGSADENELLAEFEREGLSSPYIVQSDAGDREEVYELMHFIRERGGALDVIVSNVAFGQVVRDIDGLKKKTLDRTLSYSAWPVVTLAQASKEVLGEYPRYLVAVSSDGSEVCHQGYDLIGAAKAVLETMCRYLACRLKPAGVRVNVIRPGLLATASSRQLFGDEFFDAVQRQSPGQVLEPRSVAATCVALCSGLMDSVTGQVITVDEGWSLVSPGAYVVSGESQAAFPSTEDEKA